MTCRTGISKDPDNRKAEWAMKLKQDGLKMRAWKIIGEPHKSKKSAKAAELALRIKLKSIGRPAGGKDGKGKWYVYKFNY